jgi:protein dithiol oxidoreductase (disulfide-forming)
MNRRNFSLTGSTLLTGVAAGWASLAQAQTQGQAFVPVEGKDYQLLEKPVMVEAPAGKIEVVEFFWYACTHCNAFEPTLEAWSKKQAKDVVVRRVPVAFQDSFVPLQRLFYALEAMDLLPTMHTRVFNAIHSDRLNLAKGEAIVDWVGKQGIDKDKFNQQFTSFSTHSKVTKATMLQNNYKVEGVPALGVAGRFYTDGSLAQGMGRALQVVDALVANVRRKKA